MPEKVIIHSEKYNLIESKGRLYIVPQPVKHNPLKLSNLFAGIVTAVLFSSLLLFPLLSIFIILFLLFSNIIKKGLNG